MVKSLRRSMTWGVGSLMGALLLLLSACQETPVELPEAGSIAVSGAAVTLTAGDVAYPMKAIVNDQLGRPMAPQPVVVWSSSNPTVAAVTPEGSVTPLTAGSADLTARSGGQTEVVKVTVINPVIDVRPASVQLLPGQAVALVVTVRTNTGRDLMAAESNQNLATHIVGDRTVASLSGGSGVSVTVTGATEGTTNVITRYGAVTDTTPVQVLRNANDLVTALNIVPDSMGGANQAVLFAGMPSTDPALFFDWTATSVAGGNRCAAVTTSGVVALTARNANIVTGITLQGTSGTAQCRALITLSGTTPGSTWVVMQIGSLRDSVFVRSRPQVASIAIVQDSVSYEQGTPVDGMPRLEYRVVDPRGSNICAQTQGILSITSRNTTIASLQNQGVAAGESTCYVRVSGGTTFATGSTYALLTATTSGDESVRDSVLIRQVEPAYQFAEPAIRARSIAVIGSIGLGDTLRAGQTRSVAIRVVDRLGASVRGAQVSLLVNTVLLGGALNQQIFPGALDKVTVLTDSTGHATFAYTAPTRLNSTDAPNPTTQQVELRFEGRSPFGGVIGTGPGVTSAANMPILPGPIARIIAFRPNALNVADTTQRVTVDSAYIGARTQGVSYRAYDGLGNQVKITEGTPTDFFATSITVSSSRPEQFSFASRESNVGLQDSDVQHFYNLRGDSSQVVVSAGGGAASLRVSGRFFPLGAASLGTSLFTLRSPFNNTSVFVSGPSSWPILSLAAGWSMSAHTVALTGHPDTVAVSLKDPLGGWRTYLRPLRGSPELVTAALSGAVSPPLSEGATGTGLGNVASAAFAPSPNNRGEMFAISDSVPSGVVRSRLFRRAPGAGWQVCIDNDSSYVTFTGVSVSPNGQRLLVTTRDRIDSDYGTNARGSTTDSTRFSSVRIYSTTNCALTSVVRVGAATGNEYRRPIWITDDMALVLNTFSGVRTLHRVDVAGGAGTLSSALVTFTGAGEEIFGADPTTPGGVIYRSEAAGELRFGRLPGLTPYAPAPGASTWSNFASSVFMWSRR